MIGSGDVVLVTGGTGFTGIHLVKALVATGAIVRVIARQSSNREALCDMPVEWFVGDVYDEEIVKKAVDGVHYIFHVAAAYREAKIADDVYSKVHVYSTQLLAKYAVQQSGFKRFIHTSTIGVHGHIEEPPANEDYRFAPGDEYQKTKVEAELWIRDFSERYSLPMVVVRPAAIYGPGDRRLLKVFKMAKLPLCPILGFGKNLYHLIHVEDLVSFMLLAAVHPNVLGKVYICGNENAISFQDMIQVIANKLNRRVRFIRLPVAPFFILGDICEFLGKRFNFEPPIYRRRVAFFTKDRSFDTSKMRKHTDYVCRYSNENGIKELTDWYQKQGWL